MAELGAGLGSGYPAAIDTDATKEANDGEASPTMARAEVPNDLADAIIKIETELGLDPAGTFATVVDRLNGSSLIQIVNTQTGAVATGTTLMVDDDTIPQNTEGNEFMTLAITPKSATNKLKIEVVINLASSVGGETMFVGLFQDSTANALAAMSKYMGITTANIPQQISFTHYMTSGTTSATTFKVRAGGINAGTVTFNGTSGGRKLGGVMASSITITEYGT